MAVSGIGSSTGACGLAVLICVLSGNQIARTETQIPSFRAGVELVQVDVVVLDREGRPVTGLRAADFTVLDRGRPQSVQTFTEIRHRQDEAPPLLPPPDVKADVADNANARSKRAVVLVVHDMALARSRIDAARESLRRLLAELGPQASIALLFTTGRSSVEFTSDRAELGAAIDRMDGRRDRMPAGPEAFFRLLKTMEDAARQLRFDQGRRKAMILVAPGIGADVTGLFQVMRPRPGPNPVTDKKGEARAGIVDGALVTMMDSLRRSNVTLYAVDPRGSLASASARFREEPEREEDTPIRMLDPIYQAQEGLRLTAEAAGGFAIIGGPDLGQGLNRIVADLDNYYLLGFYPERAGDKRWHELDVRVNRPDVVVRHRKGYRLGGKPPKPRNSDPMVRLSEGVLPQTDFRLRLFATPVTLSAKSGRVAAVVEVAEPATITLLAVDLKNKKVVKRLDRRSDAGGAAGSSWQFPFTLDLPPGPYQLRASASSIANGTGGSVYLSVDVPALPRTGAIIAGAALAPANAAAPGEHLLPSPVVLDRTFSAGDRLVLTYWIAAAPGGSPTASLVEVVNDQDTTVWRAAQPAAIGRVDLAVPLSRLAAGSYRLRVTAGTGSPRIRDIGFVLK